ncbi:hypothetical protein KOW79_022092 [Hemibagrus wyckioides]|uniref:Uncharacterized protein n=1 Tax=Hemibagrus wyckioides TaxID=337641 RepID=A0A9D3N4Q4_9TELE|nr:hypothetical protein KOW79_022092 [Hemibagrus wyckioides]
MTPRHLQHFRRKRVSKPRHCVCRPTGEFGCSWAMMEKGKLLDGTVADGTDQSQCSDKKISGRVEESPGPDMGWSGKRGGRLGGVEMKTYSLLREEIGPALFNILITLLSEEDGN